MTNEQLAEYMETWTMIIDQGHAMFIDTLPEKHETNGLYMLVFGVSQMKDAIKRLRGNNDRNGKRKDVDSPKPLAGRIPYG